MVSQEVHAVRSGVGSRTHGNGHRLHNFAVLLDNHFFGVVVGSGNNLIADREAGADIVVDIGAFAEVFTVELGFDGDFCAWLPVILGAPTQETFVHPIEGSVDVGFCGDFNVVFDLLLVGDVVAEVDTQGLSNADLHAITRGDGWRHWIGWRHRRERRIKLLVFGRGGQGIGLAVAKVLVSFPRLSVVF